MVGVLPSGCGFLPLVAGNKQLIRAKGHGSRLALEADKQMAQGTAKWFNPDKGFGFIAPDDGSADIFVHHSTINMGGYRTLEEPEGGVHHLHTVGSWQPELGC